MWPTLARPCDMVKRWPPSAPRASVGIPGGCMWCSRSRCGYVRVCSRRQSRICAESKDVSGKLYRCLPRLCASKISFAVIGDSTRVRSVARMLYSRARRSALSLPLTPACAGHHVIAWCSVRFLPRILTVSLGRVPAMKRRHADCESVSINAERALFSASRIARATAVASAVATDLF